MSNFNLVLAYIIISANIFKLSFPMYRNTATQDLITICSMLSIMYIHNHKPPRKNNKQIHYKPENVCECSVYNNLKK